MGGMVRRRAHRLFDRHRPVRELALLMRWPRLRKQAPDLAHIPFLEELAFGPVQRDEALLLHGLIRVVRPAVLVELGFLGGDSAFNFLRAMEPDAVLYSFDIDPGCAEVARRRFGHDARLRFRLRSQEAIEAADLDGRRADFVFVDASHDLDVNAAAFERLLGLMEDRALLVVHDTGTVPRTLIPPGHQSLELRDRWIGDAEFEPQPGERAFVNWLREAHPEFAQVHLHSHRTVRWGLTVLQRSGPLPRP